MSEVIVKLTSDHIKVKGAEYVQDFVRCQDCRWGNPYSDKQLECDALGLGGLKFPDDYCSYGVRKTNTTAEKKPTPIRDYMVHGERE